MSEDESFARLASFVEDEMEFATSHYNESYLKRRIASRMRRTESDDYTDYLRLLRNDADERFELLECLSINVTGFFRNPDVWDGVRSVLRRLSEDDGPIRVWSAACADGREPYSLVMLALDDPRTTGANLDVLGTDINETALAAAREGVYENTRTVDIDEQLGYLSNYHRYVQRSEGTFRVRDALKDLVRFEQHDLISGTPKSGFDLVLCRNLFIYIDSEYKKTILRTIADSIRPGGFLVIGKAETIPLSLKSEFSIIDGRLRIYRREE